METKKLKVLARIEENDISNWHVVGHGYINSRGQTAIKLQCLPINANAWDNWLYIREVEAPPKQKEKSKEGIIKRGTLKPGSNPF